MERLRTSMDYLPSADEIRRAIGLRSQPTFTDVMGPALGMFAAGVLVGAAIALLLAPKAGEELRHELGDRMSEVREKAKHRVAEATERAV
jgi:hypothetical protein